MADLKAVVEKIRATTERTEGRMASVLAYIKAHNEEAHAIVDSSENDAQAVKDLLELNDRLEASGSAVVAAVENVPARVLPGGTQPAREATNAAGYPIAGSAPHELTNAAGFPIAGTAPFVEPPENPTNMIPAGSQPVQPVPLPVTPATTVTTPQIGEATPQPLPGDSLTATPAPSVPLAPVPPIRADGVPGEVVTDFTEGRPTPVIKDPASDATFAPDPLAPALPGETEEDRRRRLGLGLRPAPELPIANPNDLLPGETEADRRRRLGLPPQ